jgi:hypothetical protein
MPYPNTKPLSGNPELESPGGRSRTTKPLSAPARASLPISCRAAWPKGQRSIAPNLERDRTQRAGISSGSSQQPFTAAAAENQALLGNLSREAASTRFRNPFPVSRLRPSSRFPTPFCSPLTTSGISKSSSPSGQNGTDGKLLAGMHGVHLPLADFGLNGYCPPTSRIVCHEWFRRFAGHASQWGAGHRDPIHERQRRQLQWAHCQFAAASSRPA